MNDACTRADQFGGKHLNQTSSYKYKSKEGSTSRIMRAKETNKNREESDIDKIDNKLRRGNSPKETERLKKLRRELEK